MPGLKRCQGTQSCPAQWCRFVGPATAVTIHWRSFHAAEVLLYLCPLPGCVFQTPKPSTLRGVAKRHKVPELTALYTPSPGGVCPEPASDWSWFSPSTSTTSSVATGQPATQQQGRTPCASGGYTADAKAGSGIYTSDFKPGGATLLEKPHPHGARGVHRRHQSGNASASRWPMTTGGLAQQPCKLPASFCLLVCPWPPPSQRTIIVLFSWKWQLCLMFLFLD